MNNFEVKKAIILSGDSKIFANWKQLVPELTEQDFIEAVQWVCDDPCDGGNGRKMTREIGLTRNGIVKLKRTYRADGGFAAFYRLDTGRLCMLWTGDSFRVPCDNPDYADDDGMFPARLEISLSCKDNV